MASWTDKKPEFNPYIAQKPVEAMVKVGMQKQAQYDQGYEKIQQSIDQVAGMDVVRPEDKAYLESKMQQLGSKLQIVAAGDFSNFQLSNSVAGMANNIVKDETVLGAVASTQRWKAGNAAKTAANKKGTGSPANDYDFDRQAQDWFNGGPEATFNGSYTPHVDYKKNALAIIKELTGDSTITEDAFTTDANGQLTISDAIIRKSVKGLTPQKVRMALDAGLSPADKNQMYIDGRYQYAGATPESLIEAATGDLRKQEYVWGQQKKHFESQLTTTTSVPQQNILNAKIEAIDNQIAGAQASYVNIAKSIEQDPEGAKGRLMEQKFIGNFSKAFSFTETEETFKNSPYADIAMRRDKLNRDWKIHTMKMAQDERFHIDDRADKAAARKIQQFNAETTRMNALKPTKAEIEAGLTQDQMQGGFPGLMNVESAAPNLYDYTKTQEEKRIYLEDTKADFLDTMNIPTETPQEQQEAEQWLITQEEAWKAGALDVDPDVRDYFNATNSATRELQSNQLAIAEINQATDIKFGDLYSKIPQEAVSVQVATPNGVIAVSPRELVDYNQKINKYISTESNTTGGMGGGSVTRVIYDDARAKQELTPVEYQMYQTMKKSERTGGLDESEQRLVDELDYIRENVNVPYRKEWGERTAFQDAETAKRITASQPRGYELPTDKPAFRVKVANVITNLDLIAGDSGAIAGMPDEWDKGLAKSLIVDPTIKVTLGVADATEYGDAKYMMTVTGKDGSMTVPLTQEQKRSVFQNQYESSPAKQRIQGYMSQMQKRGGNTTGWTNGPTTVNNAYLNSTDFKYSGKIGVTGNIKRSPSTGLISLRLNLYDPFANDGQGGWRENVPFGGYFSEDRLDAMMDQVNDQNIYEKLYESRPTQNDLDKVYEKLKKPIEPK